MHSFDSDSAPAIDDAGEESGTAPDRAVTPAEPAEEAATSSYLLQVRESGPLRLRPDEQALVQDECTLLLSQPLPETSLALYRHLLDAAVDGEIPAELEAPLQILIEVGLQSGRIRKLHLAHGEMAANRLYARLPAGREYRRSVEAASQALQSLIDRPLTEAHLQALGPGACSLTLAAGGRRIRIAIRRTGLTVESAEVAL